MGRGGCAVKRGRSIEDVKDVDPLYLVSMPEEVKYPTGPPLSPSLKLLCFIM